MFRRIKKNQGLQATENSFSDTGFAIQNGAAECYIGIPSPPGEKEKSMEITDEEFMTDGTERISDEVLKEAWPVVPSDESLEEFIGYLMDLDLRFD